MPLGSNKSVHPTSPRTGAVALSTSGFVDVLTSPANFEPVKSKLEAAGLKPIEAEVVMRPSNRVAVSGEAAETLKGLLDWLEELDDVQDVHHNADLPA